MKLEFRGKIVFVFFALLLIQGLVIFFWATQVLKDAIISSILVAGIVGSLLLIPVTKNIKRLHDSSKKVLRGEHNLLLNCPPA